jgi:hypothetical protein
MTQVHRKNLERIIYEHKRIATDENNLKENTKIIISAIEQIQQEKKAVFEALEIELYKLDKKARDKRHRNMIKKVKKQDKKFRKINKRKRK